MQKPSKTCGELRDESAACPIAGSYAERLGNPSALHLLSSSHFIIGLVFLEASLYLALCGRLDLFTVAILSVSFCALVTVLFRTIVILAGAFRNPEIRVSTQAFQSQIDSTLPMYTILVPLFHEANVAASIVHYISRLQYPSNRLDVKLLLEEDDQLTVDAVRALTLGPEFDVILIPPSEPRTKPKACNCGLDRARGEFVVVFDAEDRPESDQLLKVVHAFTSIEPSATCIQAKLNYYNARENMLTRWFSIEYTLWFDLFLPGLQLIGAPIPLGGTSNHFRTCDLLSMGGWDPFNVTEDCDLGVRLAIRNHRTVLIDSTTWEEANTELGNWMRQRSRWVKGYLQTHLVHTGRPLSLVRSLGVERSVCFLLTVGGVAFMQLINLLVWSAMLIYLCLLSVDILQGRNLWTVIAGSRDEYRLAWKMLYWGPGEDPAWSRISIAAFFVSTSMFFANGLFILIGLLACRRRGYKDLWFAALTSPVYWLLASIAAWKGAAQLITRPHFWEKTNHGLSRISNDSTGLDEGNR